MDELANNRGSQAVHRVLRILLCWNEYQPTLTLTEVAKQNGLTLPTAHRMIKALQDEDFLVQDSTSGKYSLGPAVTELARVVLQRGEQDELPIVSLPHLERMRAISGETVGLHLPMADSRTCVAELVSREAIRTATGVGRSYPLPRGAAGKILVAWSAERLAMAQKRSDDDSKELTKELARVVRQGYAVSQGETIPGARAIALPVFASGGIVVAAINVTGPAHRWTKDRMLAVLPELSEEVAQIATQLGYRPAQGKKADRSPAEQR